MLYIIVATVLTSIIAASFAIARFYGYEKNSFYLKVIASFGFLLIAIFSFLENNNNVLYFQWIFMALLFGFGGDVFLGLKNLLKGKKIYLITIGILLFLFGHITYSINYILQGGVPWWIFLVNIAVAIIMMSLSKKLKYKLSFAFTVLGYLYCYTISLMLTTAVSYFTTFKLETSAVMVLIGSISFYISDCLLSATYFKTDLKKIRCINLIVHFTYYLAQILLALSILYV